MVWHNIFDITSEVTKSWKSKSDDAYVHWRRVPLHVWDMWFDRFREKRDFMSYTIYDNVKKHWESDVHKKLSQISKANRMKQDSLSSPSSHCGGSISTAKRIRKLVNF
ncbi:hypothetical protein M9H77_02733 [Catharanthus roseus]|uniref:Uncharacterized protein n=1 Tax=Catharanthus roseus TaxID=4058 RepID=A0ACC0C9F0_CATRO|nr:hypothetical protein M9H77_02733 [Catharanthus roseus]